MKISIDISWLRFLADLPPDEIKNVLHAVWDYANGDKTAGSDTAAWYTIKAQIDDELQRKEQISEKRRAAIMTRWNKVVQEPAVESNEIVEPATNSISEFVDNRFVSLTNDLDIVYALNDPKSDLSIFLETGAGYDSLTKKEREFADRGDVRALCTWHKEIVAATKVVQKKPFRPPTLDEWLDFCREKNLDLDKMRNAYEGYRVADWHDTEGKPIRNWKQKILVVWASRPSNYNQKSAKFSSSSPIDELYRGMELADQMLKEQGII